MIVGKKIEKKKRKEEPENVFEKKMVKKKIKNDTKIFFIFTDFEFYDCYMFYCLIVIFYYCNFVDQFDMRKNGTLV